MALLADFIGRIKQRQERIAESLVQGNAVTFEAYQRLVGQHQGLEEALLIVNQLLEEEKNVERR
jgi:hypothetical protein